MDHPPGSGCATRVTNSRVLSHLCLKKRICIGNPRAISPTFAQEACAEVSTAWPVSSASSLAVRAWDQLYVYRQQFARGGARDMSAGHPACAIAAAFDMNPM